MIAESFLNLLKFFALYKLKKYKNPMATKKNLKANAEKGSLLSIIGFVVTKAEDHKITKRNGKILITAIL